MSDNQQNTKQVSILTKNRITEFFCIADDFCKEYAQAIKEKKALPAADDKKRRNLECEMSDSEIITVLILCHFGSFKNFKHFYPMYIGVTLRADFPELLSYSRFIKIGKTVIRLIPANE